MQINAETKIQYDCHICSHMSMTHMTTLRDTKGVSSPHCYHSSGREFHIVSTAVRAGASFGHLAYTGQKDMGTG